MRRGEISSVLHSIHEDEAPGNDGYSFYVFKVAWSIVGITL